MRYYRIWADERGDAHIDEAQIDYHDVTDYAAGVPPVAVSDAIALGEGHFSVLPAGWFGDWHPAPSRQYVVLLQGRLEVTTEDSAMIGEPGTVWLIEDTTGIGHRTRVLGDEDAIRFSVTLDAEVED